MRAKYFVVLLALIFALPVTSEPQQHAPTLETCRADLALWYDKESATKYNEAETLFISDGVKNLTPAAKLPLTEVEARLTEMGKCFYVDNQHLDDYYDADRFYSGVRSDRYAGFIHRHHLMAQLREEDAEGLR
jgi:hypothetical protein